MRRLELSPRLAAIAEQVPQGARLADVGTDHAYLPAWLPAGGAHSGAVATDVREGPSQRGRETARLYKVEDRMVFRCCDGLAAVEPQEADTVVIAGMGGELMARIGRTCPLDPGVHPSAPAHERPGGAPPVAGDPWVLHSAGDPGPGGREVLRDSHGHRGESPAYTLAELWAGRQRRGEVSPHRLAYLEEQIRRRERALAGMAQGKTPPQGRWKQSGSAGRAAADEGGVEQWQQ